ncbi:MAG: hypothetical protein QM652_12500 [Legionella sp.]|uniref:hypothetical protein n=1 Tax=Legionella sp. TaxID=459 RepID=UPI0039E6E0F4
MPINISYKQDVNAVSFSLSEIGSIKENYPEIDALKANIAEQQLKVESKLIYAHKRVGSIFANPVITYYSTEISFLIKVQNFTSMEDMKIGILKGFSDYYAGSKDQLQYIFDSDSKEKLINYFNSGNAPEVIEASALGCLTL